MESLTIFLKDLNKSVSVKNEIELYSITKEFNIKKDSPIVLGRFNNDIYELSHIADIDGEFEAITTREDIGKRTYERSLQFVLIKAAYKIFEQCDVCIEHSLSGGLFCEIHKNTSLTEEEIKLLENEMRRIIEKDIRIVKVNLEREKAIEIFKGYGMGDKVEFLEGLSMDRVNLYKLEDRYDYFYGPMVYSTGVLKVFELKIYNGGLIIRFPNLKEPNSLTKYVEYKKLANIYKETNDWGNILKVPTLGALNKLIDKKGLHDMVLINEGLHEKKLAYIADSIKHKESVKLVLIAGPSSSGKTTFTKRLSIQLAVNGVVPIQISMDDFFVDRELTPKDENGQYDFESVHALDIKLFNSTLKKILDGEAAELPSFNFITGKREWKGHKVSLPKNGVILIEGIHALNEIMTSSIEKDEKFKVYINCFTQLNIDNHNRIPTTDVRMVRRIVRDSLIRGYSGEDTLKMWPSIKRGEKKNIFVYQEEADVLFNSNLVYELCMLKKYAIYELKKIKKDSPVYYEALRLISFLKFFRDGEIGMIPSNSILKEFVGGSCFYDY
ncbi:nucleoside kinase [Hathewaya histolytica]|uniref:Phosphoribulokinase family protein n=1 Tax=Hathewaya histolytica TaxID=1498 RepID=A0A4U9R337_HATHI|nr:nucleoside kinase [Hathewaya histolytica]VTQ84978.1 phosphoribulokinase family protein [Hathewaya histolytica]